MIGGVQTARRRMAVLTGAVTLVAGTVGGVATAESGTERATTSTRYVRAFDDGRADLHYNVPKRHFSARKRAAADIRHVRVWQENHRDAYVTVTMRGALPGYARAPRTAWDLSVFMKPSRPSREPQVSVYLRPGRKARIAAWWDDGSHERCRTAVERSNRGRTYTFFLPWRCSWYSVERITVQSWLDNRDFMDAPGALDRKVVRARLKWDDDLGRDDA
ncbi:hypothetical protein ACT8ZV_10325 [Nocardioides sp. MAHUQ-72]|uniref:hypothetical protein n=1 Tax=unclassified Nocardioides TaxID=2615069 RepID=UPI0036165B26